MRLKSIIDLMMYMVLWDTYVIYARYLRNTRCICMRKGCIICMLPDYNIQMPEGPEVEAVAKAIRHIEGQSIIDLKLHLPAYKNKAYLPDSKEFPLVVKAVEYIGKRIAVHIHTAQSKHIVLWIFLAMSGTVRYVPDKHTRGYLTFGKVIRSRSGQRQLTLPGWRLYFNETRPFGFFYIVEPAEIIAFSRTLGPCLVTLDDMDMFRNYLASTGIQSSSKSIAIMLLDNKYFNGVGNYLRSDILFLACIHPLRECRTLTGPEWSRLIMMCGVVIQRSRREGGMSMRDYKHPDGALGTYQTLVYGRKSTSSGYEVSKIEVDKRPVYLASNQI